MWNQVYISTNLIIKHRSWSDPKGVVHNMIPPNVFDFACVCVQVMECRRGCFLRSKSPQVTRTACRQQCVSTSHHHIYIHVYDSHVWSRCKCDSVVNPTTFMPDHVCLLRIVFRQWLQKMWVCVQVGMCSSPTHNAFFNHMSIWMKENVSITPVRK